MVIAAKARVQLLLVSKLPLYQAMSHIEHIVHSYSSCCCFILFYCYNCVYEKQELLNVSTYNIELDNFLYLYHIAVSVKAVIIQLNHVDMITFTTEEIDIQNSSIQSILHWARQLKPLQFCANRNAMFYKSHTHLFILSVCDQLNNLINNILQNLIQCRILKLYATTKK